MSEPRCEKSRAVPSARTLLRLTAAGLLVRSLWLLLEPATQPVADERTWTNWAIEALLSERIRLDPLRTRMIFYPPVYPYFIALAYLPFGALAAVKWAQVLVSAALIPVLGRLGGRAFGPRAGVAVAALVAFYPDLVWYSVHFWSETLFLLLLWLAFDRLLAADAGESRGAAVAAGLLWGVAILTRETALYFTPLAAAWLWWRRGERGGLGRAAAFALSALLVVAPWTWRNSVVFPGAFVPVSTAGGLNLWQGNAGIPRYEIYRLYDRVPGRVEQYRYARRMGLQAIWDRQPTWLFEKLYDELPRFFEADSLALIHIQRGAYGPVRPLVAVAAAVVVIMPYLAVLAFFVLALAALRPGRRDALLLGYLAFHTGLHVVTHGFARYRMPIMPVLFLYAAAAFAAWRAGTLPELGRRRRIAGVALAALFALLLAPSFRSHASHPSYDLSRPLTPYLRESRSPEPAGRPPRRVRRSAAARSTTS